MELNWVYLHRDVYTTRSTHGEIFFGASNERFSYTLEDTVRPDGIKVYGETAIKGGTLDCPEVYDLSIHYSNKFKRQVVMLSNTTSSHIIRHDNVEFGYVYVHGGNKHKNTLGCVLCAKNRNIEADSIQGTMEAEFIKRVKGLLKLGQVKMAIINKPQDS